MGATKEMVRPGTASWRQLQNGCSDVYTFFLVDTKKFNNIKSALNIYPAYSIALLIMTMRTFPSVLSLVLAITYLLLNTYNQRIIKELWDIGQT